MNCRNGRHLRLFVAFQFAVIIVEHGVEAKFSIDHDIRIQFAHGNCHGDIVTMETFTVWTMVKITENADL